MPLTTNEILPVYAHMVNRVLDHERFESKRMIIVDFLNNYFHLGDPEIFLKLFW